MSAQTEKLWSVHDIRKRTRLSYAGISGILAKHDFQPEAYGRRGRGLYSEDVALAVIEYCRLRDQADAVLERAVSEQDKTDEMSA